MSSKRLLFISTRQFWPLASGKDITLFHNCKGLHEKYGYEIYLFCFIGKEEVRPKPEFIHEVMYVHMPDMFHVAMNLIGKCMLGDWPLQNALFYQNQIEQQLLSYYREVQPSVVFLDMVRLTPYFRHLAKEPVRKVLIEDDSLAKRYQRQLDTAANGNIAGYISSSLPNIMNRIVNNQRLRELILKKEIRKLNRYEGKNVAVFDYITFISAIEAEEFNTRYHTAKAKTLTMGTDTRYYAGGKAGPHRENSLSIVGLFEYAPNAASLEWTNSEILPLLPDNVTYYVIGKCPEELKQKVDSERIVMLGYVEDLRPVVKSTDVYLAPVLFGTGIKTKIVEAMAMGMPVVTNSTGAEGLAVQNGRELFIADDPQELANITMQLLNDPELRKEVGLRGQSYVQEHHDWERIYCVFGEMGL